ncbi:SIS domain-containing protein [Clostridium sp. Marseille-P3244]|uniref:SIS domain-containing protein n=1 Tax=Clostridium sp. Marseille-P3244 TaxID=1871020 RepID=UPI0009F85D4E|nr:SIS domain-containing protein [Clostridium sp. Marseille-P3244]
MEKLTYTSPQEMIDTIEEIREKLKDKNGIQNLYLLGCGGSLAGLYPLEYFMRSESVRIPCRSINANEFVYDTPKGCTENSIVICMSLAGTTPETVAAAKKAEETGATVITMSISKDVPLAQYGQYHWTYGSELRGNCSYEDVNLAKVLRFGIELLRIEEEYADYEKALKAFSVLDEMCEKAKKQVAKRAVEFAEQHKDDPVIYTLGCGATYCAAYMQTICMFMEMEWINSGTIHSGELYHGPFEITDKNTPFFVFVNEGKTRFLDERACRFLEKYSGRVTVLDAKELGICVIDSSVVDYFNPILLWSCAVEYTKALADAKKHPLMHRRYMFKVEY